MRSSGRRARSGASRTVEYSSKGFRLLHALNLLTDLLTNRSVLSRTKRDDRSHKSNEVCVTETKNHLLGRPSSDCYQ